MYCTVYNNVWCFRGITEHQLNYLHGLDFVKFSYQIYSNAIMPFLLLNSCWLKAVLWYSYISTICFVELYINIITLFICSQWLFYWVLTWNDCTRNLLINKSFSLHIFNMSCVYFLLFKVKVSVNLYLQSISSTIIHHNVVLILCHLCR